MLPENRYGLRAGSATSGHASCYGSMCLIVEAFQEVVNALWGNEADCVEDNSARTTDKFTHGTENGSDGFKNGFYHSDDTGNSGRKKSLLF